MLKTWLRFAKVLGSTSSTKFGKYLAIINSEYFSSLFFFSSPSGTAIIWEPTWNYPTDHCSCLRFFEIFFSFHSSDYVISVNRLQICESFLLWFQCTVQPIKIILHFRYFTFQFWNSHWVLLIVFISLQSFLIVYSYSFFYLSPWKILSSCMLISTVMSFQYLYFFLDYRLDLIIFIVYWTFRW